MDKRERVLTALACGTPDMVPFMESTIDKPLQERLLGADIRVNTASGIDAWGKAARPGEIPAMRFETASFAPGIAQLLHYDAIGMDCLPPLYLNIQKDAEGTDGIHGGLLKTPQDIERVRLPDPDDEGMYAPLLAWISRYQGQYALYARIRLGISPVLNSMGFDSFAYMIYDHPDAVKALVETYTGWCGRVARNLCGTGLDLLWAFDDLAEKSNTLFSPQVYDEFFSRAVKKAAEAIRLPWIYHSDGNIMPLLERLLELGMSGLHPLEPGCMDLDALKRDYGKRVCLMGNIDIAHTLSQGTPEEVEKEVHERITQLGPGGGYILTSANSLPAYVKSENVMAMSRAMEKYRRIYD